MTFSLDIGYQSKASSVNLNTRFLDVFGGKCVLQGFEVTRSGNTFTIAPGVAIDGYGRRISSDSNETYTYTYTGPGTHKIKLYIRVNFGLTNAPNATVAEIISSVATGGGSPSNPTFDSKLWIEIVEITYASSSTVSIVNVAKGIQNLQIANQMTVVGSSNFNGNVSLPNGTDGKTVNIIGNFTNLNEAATTGVSDINMVNLINNLASKAPVSYFGKINDVQANTLDDTVTLSGVGNVTLSTNNTTKTISISVDSPSNTSFSDLEIISAMGGF